MSKGSATIYALSLALLAGSAIAQAPAGPRPISAGFFDPRYNDGLAKADWRQHLGTDYTAPAGSPVWSPAAGTVVRNATGASDIMQAYLVIREANGTEHVLGHIASPLREGVTVQKDQSVGKIRDWGSRSHVHWGINRLGVIQAIRGDWGWGRAPFTASRTEAKARGWVG
jgi:murein DD-endopeptidase MepM/ murein hydrolase activator NlpD